MSLKLGAMSVVNVTVVTSLIYTFIICEENKRTIIYLISICTPQ